MLAICFTSCKKGPNDPAFSLRSRKARLTGNWSLVSGSKIEVEPNPSIKIVMEEYYDEESCDRISTQGSARITDFIAFNKKMNFADNGSFVFTTTYKDRLIIERGTWSFAGKMDGKKNKEQIIVTLEEVETTVTYNNTIASAILHPNTRIRYAIKELRNKSMEIYGSYTYTDKWGYKGSISEEYKLGQ